MSNGSLNTISVHRVLAESVKKRKRLVKDWHTPLSHSSACIPSHTSPQYTTNSAAYFCIFFEKTLITKYLLLTKTECSCGQERAALSTSCGGKSFPGTSHFRCVGGSQGQTGLKEAAELGLVSWYCVCIVIERREYGCMWWLHTMCIQNLQADMTQQLWLLYSIWSMHRPCNIMPV